MYIVYSTYTQKPRETCEKRRYTYIYSGKEEWEEGGSMYIIDATLPVLAISPPALILPLPINFIPNMLRKRVLYYVRIFIDLSVFTQILAYCENLEIVKSINFRVFTNLYFISSNLQILLVLHNQKMVTCHLQCGRCKMNFYLFWV